MRARVTLVGAALTACAVTAIVVGIARGRGPASLFPGKDAARYRFSVEKPILLPNAIPMLEERAKTQPSAIDLAELSQLYFHQGHQSGDPGWFDKAEATAKASLKLLPSPNAAKLTLAKVADARHQFPEAIRLAREVAAERGAFGAYAVLVSSSLALGDLEDAARYADLALDKRPDSGAFLMRALVLSAQGRDEEASFDFSRAVVVEDHGGIPEAARLRSLWGRFLARRGDYRSAGALFDEALRIAPGNHLALALRGDMELRRGKYTEAQKHLLEAFTASKQLRYLIHYARAKALAGDAAAAGELWAQAEKLVRRELTEKAYGHRLDLADLLLDRGKPEDVREAVTLAQAELGIRHSAEARATLARSLLAAGRAEEAAEPMRAVLRTGVRDPEYFHLAGLVESARDNGPRAVFYNDLALRIDPTFAPALESRKRGGKPTRVAISR